MTEWTKRRRLEAIVNGDRPDRLPVALWRHWPGDDQDAAALAAAHLKWQKDYDWDLVKVSPASSYCLVDWGVEDRWEGAAEGTRVYGKRLIQEPEDWRKLKALDPKHGMLAAQLQALKLVGEGLGNGAAGGTPFIATIFSPLAQAKNLAGGQRLFSHLRSHPDDVMHGLETICDSVVRYVEAAKSTGISGIFYAIQHARYALMSPVEYQMFGRPFDERILSAASDLWFNMIHIHGEEDIMFDLVSAFPVQCINWHDRDTGFSLAEGLEQFSGAVSGGVSRWSLLQESPEQALAEAKEALNKTGRQRLMLGVGCVIMTNTPTRNIRALRALVDEVS
ncbi:MAG TPA: uroporphyrinogen decarboxylase family protein [Anaerolineae bacterium]|nr:uroporphyrinogen decarboxylase family protein [Anaerolineae bacterium]